MDMRTVLITGATSGIGLSIANKLHENGFTVFGTSRFPEQHQHKVAFELLPMDITSEESIKSCLVALSARTLVIDALINNAENDLNGSAEETSSALARSQFEINFWGTVNMTKAVLPLMRAQKSGQIITIGSLAGLVGIPFQSFYVASKYALEGFFKSLRFEVKPFNIRISVVEPAFFKTNLVQGFAYAEPTIAAYTKDRENALSVYSSSIKNGPSPEPVANVVLKILRTTRPQFSYRVGSDAKTLPVIQFLSYPLYEWGAARRFNI
ncbi:SDR family NAD(P)-dependent oxidoreductase [Spirosoma sp. HMF3257]|uniref:Short-chain dehydrogenase/reductase n=2 Tax=Spirosoma telluris TaxID=2183553 RepID=A0A327ND33_9BACT|nr:SDR family NAD(P)-dependent oxidoreductase [Spirosoma telluris]RAI73127.1 short-chain dehydrogenase/reductase [Spirosoma telluris]